MSEKASGEISIRQLIGYIKTALGLKYSKPSCGIPASDLASAVQTSLGKADTALQPDALQTELDDNVHPARFVLVRNGNTLTTVDTFISIVSLLFSTPRRVMFFIVASQSGGTVTSALELYPTMIDTNSRALTLAGYFDGNRYTAELKAASASSTMTGTLTVEPIVTQSDIPTAVSQLTNDSGYQTAAQVQTAIEETVMVVHLTPTSTDLSGVMDKTGSEILTAYSAGKRIVAEVDGLNGSFEWNQTSNGSMVTQFLYNSGSNRELIQVVASGSSTAYYAYHIAQLPAVTASDNGKFLRVVNGAWAAATIPAAESNSFGGGA